MSRHRKTNTFTDKTSAFKHNTTWSLRWIIAGGRAQVNQLLSSVHFRKIYLSPVSYMGDSVLFSSALSSGCHMSMMSISRVEWPSCQTSCSNESSNTKNSPSVHVLVSLPTLIRGPSGTTSPRWARMRQLVGPLWGHTCTPGCITENLIWKNQDW